MQLTNDEIVEATHAIRFEHAASFDFDMVRILDDLKASEQAHTEQGWPLIQAAATVAMPDTKTYRVRLVESHVSIR